MQGPGIADGSSEGAAASAPASRGAVAVIDGLTRARPDRTDQTGEGKSTCPSGVTALIGLSTIDMVMWEAILRRQPGLGAFAWEDKEAYRIIGLWLKEGSWSWSWSWSPWGGGEGKKRGKPRGGSMRSACGERRATFYGEKRPPPPPPFALSPRACGWGEFWQVVSGGPIAWNTARSSSRLVVVECLAGSI